MGGPRRKSEQTSDSQSGQSAPRYVRIWQRRLKELAAFKKKYGHCSVSTVSKTHASLGCWVRTQRGKRRRGQLSQGQIKALDELGFDWGMPHSNSTWESMYNALAAYWRARGQCRVSRSDKENVRLADWIKWQRRARRKGILSADRIRRLDELGFSWTPGGFQAKRDTPAAS